MNDACTTNGPSESNSFSDVPFSSHVSPISPGGQIQTTLSEREILHVAPFLQGEFSHGLAGKVNTNVSE